MSTPMNSPAAFIDTSTPLSASMISFNTTNLQNSSGLLNTIQNISSASSPTFSGLTLSTTPLPLTSGGTGNTTGTATINANLTGDVTSVGNATTIASNAVTYAKFQQINGATLVGNTSGSTANAGVVTIGSTFRFSGTSLQTQALTGDVTTTVNSFATTLANVNSNTGTFGSATQVGTFSVNGKGLITAASNVNISGVSPGGSAGGDLSGTYPNPTVVKINTVPVASSTVTDGQILIGSSGSANFSAANILGTTNQINVANSSNGIRLSTPQSIAISSSPIFAGLTLSSPLTVGNGGTGTATTFTQGNLVSVGAGGAYGQNNSFITSSQMVTTATQSLTISNRYFNNYTGGQCAYTLPAATGTNGLIEVIGLNTASTSGWIITAGTGDKIQVGSSLSAAAGNIQSTTSSTTDSVTLRDVATNLWVVYPYLGTNIIVT